MQVEKENKKENKLEEKIVEEKKGKKGKVEMWVQGASNAEEP